MIAVKHVDYELGLGGEIVAIERYRDVQLYQKAKNNTVNPTITMKRRVDIELEDEDDPTRTIWVEVKSYKTPFKAGYWSPWKANTPSIGSSNVKEWFLDRFASTDNTLSGSNNQLYILSTRFEWWLQDFNRSTTYKGYSVSDMARLREALAVSPGRSGLMLGSLGYKKASDNKLFATKTKSAVLGVSDVQLFNLKTWIVSDGIKGKLLDGISDSLITDLLGQ